MIDQENSAKEENTTTYFGFEKVTLSEKKKRIAQVFDSVASRYDLMNDLMSFGLHRLWKKHLISMINLNEGDHVLDVAGGTGDITFKLIEKAQEHKIETQFVICDLTPAMIEKGQDRAIDRGLLQPITWVCGDAQQLPWLDNSFDLYVISFGLRNVPSPLKAIQEAYRVLKPGGRFYCLEFSKIFIPAFRKAYQCYAFNIIPKLGKKIVQDEASYQYLVESIEQFPNQEELAGYLLATNFEKVNFKNLSIGVVAIHYGIKPTVL